MIIVINHGNNYIMSFKITVKIIYKIENKNCENNYVLNILHEKKIQYTKI